MKLIFVLKRIPPFFASFALGVTLAGSYADVRIEETSEPEFNFNSRSPKYYGQGSTSGCHGPEFDTKTGFGANSVGETAKSHGLKIISKPRPAYTDDARKNNVQGTVVLRIMFLASGQIGGIQTDRGLPNGLTEQAIRAARGIRFEPVLQDGRPVSVAKQVEYNFSEY